MLIVQLYCYVGHVINFTNYMDIQTMVHRKNISSQSLGDTHHKVNIPPNLHKFLQITRK